MSQGFLPESRTLDKPPERRGNKNDQMNLPHKYSFVPNTGQIPAISRLSQAS
jgi:hypothetical protein